MQALSCRDVRLICGKFLARKVNFITLAFDYTLRLGLLRRLYGEASKGKESGVVKAPGYHTYASI